MRRLHVACTSHTHEEGHRAWSAPQHLKFLRPSTCSVNDELQLSHAWVPIVHVRDKYEAATKGMWFYYARGCSNLEYDTGQTLAAKNRLHAALKLTMNATCSFECARALLAKTLITLTRDVALISKALDDTLYCPVDRRHAEYSHLSGSGYLEPYIYERLRFRGYDSLQLLFQPQGGRYDANWQTEILDIRDEKPDANLDISRIRKHFRCNGGPCNATFVRDTSGRQCLVCGTCRSQCRGTPDAETGSKGGL